jgi:NhaA family Na+:H+ antiporter
MTERAPDPSPPDPTRRTRRRETPTLAGILRTETVGGALLLVAALFAMLWANSPWAGAYQALGRLVPLPAGGAAHLDLTLTEWAADGLLAVFFFVVGLELKREFVTGDLRRPRQAVLPVVAALGGMVLPAVVYTAVNVAAPEGVPRGWAIPIATDIAFALAVLAVVGSRLPQGLRAFLLTLAVVDDLVAITVIAVFYTDHLAPVPLLAAAAPVALFALLLRRGWARWYVLAPLALAAWVLVHASGVHATVAGVLLGLTVPARPSPGGGPSPAERLEHRWQPVSAGFAVPVFAFFAAGVPLPAVGLGRLLTDPLVVGVVAGLVVGKSVGVLGATWLVSRFTHAELDADLGWADLLGVALLSGVGFTVALLIGELAVGVGTGQDAKVKVAVLAGSLTSAVLASVVLRRREVAHRRRARAAGQR